MTDDTQTATAEYRAEADASSHSPADWGRAAGLVLQGLAEQAVRDERGTGPEVLLDADVLLHVAGTPDGVRITGSWRPAAAQDA